MAVWAVVFALLSCTQAAGKPITAVGDGLLAFNTPSHPNTQVLLQTNQPVLAQSAAGTPGRLSVAGKCFLCLATLYFAIEALLYMVRYRKARQEKQESKSADGDLNPLSLFDLIFTEDRLVNAQDALFLIPAVSVLILFIMFRAHVQTVQMNPFVQWGMIFTTIGIWLQALFVMDVSITSCTGQPISEKLGMLISYLGFFIIVWGAFTVKDPSVPLSAAGGCLIALSTLVFILVLFMKFQEMQKMIFMKQKAEAEIQSDTVSPSDEATALMMKMKNSVFDEGKLVAYKTTCDYVSLPMIMFFYFHFRMLNKSEPLPSLAVLAMYVATLGVYVQALSVVLFQGVLDKLFVVARAIGICATYGGFGIVCYYAMSEGEVPSVSVACTLELLSVVAVIKIGLVIMEEDTLVDAPVDKKQMLTDMLATAQYANILSILMLYIHFRCVLILNISEVPGWVEVCQYAATYAIFIQILIVLLQGILASPPWANGVKFAALLVMYLGFGGTVYAAFVVAPAASMI